MALAVRAAQLRQGGYGPLLYSLRVSWSSRSHASLSLHMARHTLWQFPSYPLEQLIKLHMCMCCKRRIKLLVKKSGLLGVFS